MASIREQALSALETLLAAIPSTSFARNRPEPVRLAPGTQWLVLRAGALSAPDMQVGRWDYQQPCVIEGSVGTSAQATVEAACDALYVATAAVLAAAYVSKLGVAGVESVDPGTCEFAVPDSESSGPIMGFEQDIIIHFATAPDDPSSAP